VDFPPIEEREEIEFNLSLKNPRNLKKVRRIQGTYKVKKRKFIYSTDDPAQMGLSQYIELEPVHSK
jgi:hypothetical protein